MKISYSWLKKYINTTIAPVEMGCLLTDCGLEVESIEKFESIKGGLDGLIIGEIISKEKHPDADRLNITTVDIGTGTLLNIVCGASNVEVGQKVVVASIGTNLYPLTGEGFQIKKSKIRGQLSEGMICAEDEIGLGISHEGIIVLDEKAIIGSLVKDYFNIEEDFVFEIGLTPNRADAASHIGVARDLAAVIENLKHSGQENFSSLNTKLILPSVENFKVDNNNLPIEVIVEDTRACPRYSGISISNVEIKESPAWLVNRLKSIGIKPINNIVDITNFVLHEIGQPLHAFDAGQIIGNKIIVRYFPEGTKFKTLDGIERNLSEKDLMISNKQAGMCIAGIFGGIDSGIKPSTKNIFLESAYFDAVSVRKTSKFHGLKTDASFRYERGTDPNITVYALKRAAMLIKEIAGGNISSHIIDIYPHPVSNFSVALSYANCDKIIGKEIERAQIKNILTSLDIAIINENPYGLSLSVPAFKVDVQREIDVIEEILRIYGYNNIEMPESFHSSISFSQKPDKTKVQNVISDLLSDKGFNEIMSNSLTSGCYYEQSSQKESAVKILNPLSSDLNVLRQTLLFGGLESVVYNQNRKNVDLKLYEFGKTYHLKSPGKYKETQHLSLFMCGRKNIESWNSNSDFVNFYFCKGFVENVLSRLGIDFNAVAQVNSELFSFGVSFENNKNKIVELGSIKKNVLKDFDVSQDVFFADFNWDIILELIENNKVKYQEVSKFPSVRRDLALLVDKQIRFEQIEQLAFQVEKDLLRKVNLFDVYEGEKLDKEKKSYAVSFTLQDENGTLTDKQIERIMEKLMKTFQEKLDATIR